MIIKTYLDKSNGVQVSVVMLKNGRYSVVTYDIDAMQYLDGCVIFLDRSQAINYARKCVEYEPESLSIAVW